MKQEHVLFYKKRIYARRAVSRALRKGELVKPCVCEICSQSSNHIQAHHIDYGRPLDVKWFCKSCHGKAHRKNSPLNPENNIQSAFPYVMDNEKSVQISFLMPVGHFIAMQEQAEKMKVSISKLINKHLKLAYPILSPQLEFNFEVINDNPWNVSQQRIYWLEKNPTSLLQPKTPAIQKIRRTRDYDVRGMADLFEFSPRHRKHAPELQRARAS